jgi:hypothetical protein
VTLGMSVKRSRPTARTSKAWNLCTIPEHRAIPWMDWHPKHARRAVVTDRVAADPDDREMKPDTLIG